MYRLLLIALFAVSSNVSASNIFKLTETNLVCLEQEHIKTFVNTIQRRGRDIGGQYLDFILDTKKCFSLGPLLIELIDVDGDYYEIRLLELPGVSLWTHRIHLDN